MLIRSPLLLLLALSLGATVLPSAAEPPQPIEKGQRVFTCAHSFHVFTYRMVAEMAGHAGIGGHELAGLSSIGGSRVMQHWQVPDEKNLAKPALSAGKVDVLTLAPIWMPDEGIDHFAKLGFSHNPNLRITVQQFWLPNDTYEPRYPLETRKKVDHEATNLDELQKHQDKYDQDVDAYVRGINQQLGRDVIVTVPVGQAAAALRRKILAGQAPGLTKQWDLFRDTWGHAQLPLQVLSAYCHFAVIYHRNPVGLPIPTDFVKAKRPEWGDALNRLLQELAWEAVTRSPMSGVTAKSN